MRILISCSKVLFFVLFYILFFIFLLALGYFVREVFFSVDSILARF